MKISKILAPMLAGLLAASAIVSPVRAADSFSPAQKTEIENIVKDYLLAHPDILREMAQKLEDNDKAAEQEQRGKALEANAAEVFKNGSDPFVGNPQGDVTVVEFMDYNCGWCKRSIGEVQQLVKKDKNLRVVFKDFPIFGENSEYAARAALAANKQGKYWELHQALFSHEGQVTKAVVDQLAEKHGLDMAKLKADMESKEVSEALAANHELGKILLINGTPAFIIDSTVVPGYLPMDGLQAAIGEVRSAGGCKLC